MSFYSRTVDTVLSCFRRVQLLATLWAIGHQASLSMGFSRQEYRRGWTCPAPGDLPDPGIEPASLKFPALPGGFLTTSRASYAVPGLLIHIHCEIKNECWSKLPNVW